MGLGLTFARDIVTAHHGEIRNSDYRGKGTSFDLIIPLEHFSDQVKRFSDFLKLSLKDSLNQPIGPDKEISSQTDYPNIVENTIKEISNEKHE